MTKPIEPNSIEPDFDFLEGLVDRQTYCEIVEASKKHCDAVLESYVNRITELESYKQDYENMKVERDRYMCEKSWLALELNELKESLKANKESKNHTP